MNKIPTQRQNPYGLHAKYHIQKIEMTDGYFEDGELKTYKLSPTPDDAEYFVLRLDENWKDFQHFNACRMAINAYADAIEKLQPRLAKDLKERYPLPKSIGEETEGHDL